MLYLQRYGNRAVKAQLEIEADTAAEARRKAEEWIDDERADDALMEDVRLIGQPKPAPAESK